MSDNTGSSTSRVVPQEDAENAVPDTNSFEEPTSTLGIETTPTLVTEQHKVPHPLGRPDMSSVPRGPSHTPVRTYPIVSEIPLTDLLVLDI